jgi:hypothetical protein
MIFDDDFLDVIFIKSCIKNLPSINANSDGFELLPVLDNYGWSSSKSD